MTSFNRPVAAAFAVFAYFVAHDAPAQANVSDQTCQSALNSVISQWNQIGFEMPSKPGQAVVSGKDGHTLTGGQYGYIEGQLRVARKECDRGDSQSSLQHLSVVRDMIDRSGRPNG
jgi:hypothetical protein